MHTCVIGYTHTQYNLCTKLHYSLTKYLNLQFSSAFTFKTSFAYPNQFMRQQLINIPIISAGYKQLYSQSHVILAGVL